MRDKATLRRELAAKRKALHASEWSARSELAQRRLIAEELFARAKAIAL